MPFLLRLSLACAGCALFAVSPATAGAASIHWNSPVRIEPAANGGVNAVSCPSTHLCVAVDAAGDVVTTARPTGGNGSWARAVHIDSGAPLTGVSCPNAGLCVAVDAAGQELTSTRPAGGARAWSRPARIDATTAPGGGYAGLLGISCPTISLCVAVDGAQKGDVAVSTDPSGGARTWHLTAVGGTLTSVSCASSSFCVAAGSQHYVSTSPAGGAAAWRATGSPGDGGVLSAIDCRSVSLCVAPGFGNSSLASVTSSSDPRGTASDWNTVAIGADPPQSGEGVADAVGCAAVNLCVALDSFDEAYVSTAPASGAWGGAAAIRPRSAADSSAISCTSSFCVAVDSAGVETTGVVRG